MQKDLKYPIKYAVLALKETGSFALEFAKITRGFIVSKCYVIESSIKYMPNGESKMLHKVIFPFKNLEDFKWRLLGRVLKLDNQIVPKYDESDNYYLLDEVSDIFDNYEDAQELANQKNFELHAKIADKVSFLDDKWKEKYCLLENDFFKQLSICKKFEELVMIETQNMEITYEKNPIELIKKMNK